MTNAEHTAFPTFKVDEDGKQFVDSKMTGLTKREYFAALAMQGLLANDWQGYSKRDDECDMLAMCATNFADALITALNKVTQEQNK